MKTELILFLLEKILCLFCVPSSHTILISHVSGTGPYHSFVISVNTNKPSPQTERPNFGSKRDKRGHFPG